MPRSLHSPQVAPAAQLIYNAICHPALAFLASVSISFWFNLCCCSSTHYSVFAETMKALSEEAPRHCIGKKTCPKHNTPISLRNPVNGHLRLASVVALSSSGACGAITTVMEKSFVPPRFDFRSKLNSSLTNDLIVIFDCYLTKNLLRRRRHLRRVQRPRQAGGAL